MKRGNFTALVGGGLFSATAGSARAQTGYPARTVTLLCWSAAGSPVDVMARQAAKLSEKYLGQQMIVEDKTGGGTANALAYLLAQPADGYTLLAVTDSMIVALNTNLKGKFTADQFDFISQLATDPYVIGVVSSSPLKSWADFVQATKTTNVTVGGAFAESAESFFARDMRSTAGIKFDWVPFSGGAPAVAATLGGHVTAVCTNISGVSGFVAAGQMRVLAVSTAQPTSALPGTPTFASLGYKNLTGAHWRGIAAKAGLSPEVQNRLVVFSKQVAQDPEFKAFCERVHLHDEYADPTEVSKTIARQQASIQSLLARGIGGK